jgi:hypothetical protein
VLPSVGNQQNFFQAITIYGHVRLVPLVSLVYLQTDGQTSNIHWHEEQTVNGLRKIAWASVFHLMSPCLLVQVSMSPCLYFCMFPCFHVHVSMFPCLHFHDSMSPCLHVSMSPCLHVSMSQRSICLCLHVSMYVSPCFHKQKTKLFRYHEDGSKKLNACNQLFLCMVYF